MIIVDKAYSQLDQLPPQTYVDIVRGLSIKRKANGIPVMRLHYSAIPERDPDINPAWKDQKQREFSKSGWDREQEIIDEAGGGERVFADLLAAFGHKIIIRDPLWFPQPWWDVIGGMDHGGTNPTVQLKGYLDENGNLYMAGEFYQMKTDGYESSIDQNAPRMAAMPDIQQARWVSADPSLFHVTVAQTSGGKSSLNSIYREFGVRYLSPYEGDREDESKEGRLRALWANLGVDEPRLYIVCRNESDRWQPGMHPYDCPNLIKELRGIRRPELTATQQQTRNLPEGLVDKNNHAFDALSYMLGRLPRPTAVPYEMQLAKVVEGLDPTSAAISAQRFAKQFNGRQVKPVDLRNKGRMLR